MTIREVSEKYNIPLKILREYERWELCGEAEGTRYYDDSDIERLSIIMTLYDTGFSDSETEEYMKLLMQGKSTSQQRLKMLNDKRDGTLDEIHFKEKQLASFGLSSVSTETGIEKIQRVSAKEIYR